jgi:hypothetical protein
MDNTPEPKEPIKNPLKPTKNTIKAPNVPKSTERVPLILKNKKHELFAQEIIKPGVKSPTEAYANVYGITDSHVASQSAGRMLKNIDIRQRVIELLNANKSTTMQRLTERLGEHVESQEGHISMKAVELGWKLHGAMVLDNIEGNEPADITINIVNANANAINGLHK